MSTAITMPSLAPSMTEGHLVRWLKKEGDAVQAGDVLAEIETDKALVDYEAPADGVLGRIVVADGTPGVRVGATMAWLLGAGEAAPTNGAPAIDGHSEWVSDIAPLDPPHGPPRALAAVPVPPLDGSARIASSPLARRLAQRHGLSLASIRGSGSNGRIVRVDVEAALREAPRGAVTSLGAAIAEPAVEATVEPAVVAAPAAAPPAPAAIDADYDEIPHTGTRRVIAQRLGQAKREVPHFYLTIDCALDALLALRAQLNAVQPDGKLSVNDLVVRAAAVALRRVPAVNASWTETAVRRFKSVDISIAVATPAGLITPIVRQADTKTVGALSREIRELAARAKAGRLQPAEYQGGGFSVSNLGMFGIREFAAIINPPQACILAVGAAERRAVVRDGALAVATMMTCTLSLDHRVVDGAVGGEFLAAFKALVEQPLTMLA